MATKVYTYDIGFVAGAGNKEDVLDLVTNIDPEETPFLSAAPKTTAKLTTHEWLTDAYNAAAATNKAEGHAFSADTTTARQRLNNRTAIFGKDFEVTGTQQAVDPIGVATEYALQVDKATKETARNIEYTFFQNSSAAPATGDGTNARALYHFRAMHARGAGPPSYQFNQASMDGAITIAAINSICEAGMILGGKFDTVYASPGVKADITAAIVTPAYNSIMSAQGQARPQGINRYTGNVTMIEGDFNVLALVPDIFIPQSAATGDSNSLWLMERSKARIAFLRPLKHVPLPPGGDSVRGMVLGELTIEVLHPKAIGYLAGVIT